MADLFIQAGRLYTVVTSATCTNNNLAFVNAAGLATDYGHSPVFFAGIYDVRRASLISGVSAQAVVGDGSAQVSIKFPLSNEKLGLAEKSGSTLSVGDLAYASGDNQCSDSDTDGPLIGKVVGKEGAIIIIKPTEAF